MTYYLPHRVFKLILQYCDDRIEQKQRYYHRYLVKILSRVYKKLRNKRFRYYQSPVNKIVIYYEYFIEEYRLLLEKKRLQIKQKLQLKKLRWQFDYLRKIGISTKSTMSILKDRGYACDPYETHNPKNIILN